jgi:hypothetical protein
VRKRTLPKKVGVHFYEVETTQRCGAAPPCNFRTSLLDVRRTEPAQSLKFFGIRKCLGGEATQNGIGRLPTFSQRCALCYTQASSAGARMIEALRSGILVMVIPATLGSVGMIFVVRRRNNRFKRNESASEDW